MNLKFAEYGGEETTAKASSLSCLLSSKSPEYNQMT